MGLAHSNTAWDWLKLNYNVRWYGYAAAGEAPEGDLAQLLHHDSLSTANMMGNAGYGLARPGMYTVYDSQVPEMYTAYESQVPGMHIAYESQVPINSLL